MLAKHRLEDLALATFPERDALAHLAIEVAEVLLHLAKVGQQCARGLLDLQEAVAKLTRLQDRHLSSLDRVDLRVEGVALRL